MPTGTSPAASFLENSARDTDGDGIPDAVEWGPNPDLPRDTDGDAALDYLDLDSDNDGIPDAIERGLSGQTLRDTDQDGIPDYLDTDSDGDGIPDRVEWGPNPTVPLDADGDGTPDYLETDSDNDGILDAVERGPDGEHPRDTDNDGLPDYRDADSNNNGIPDTVELTANGAAKTLDTDGDGLPDYWETFAGLNPNDPADAATRPAGAALTYLQIFRFGLNPRMTDIDGDGLNDYDELFVYGTNPLLRDTDGDGMDDGWEVAHGLDPRRNDANEDRDFDFVTNLEEYRARLDPLSPDTGATGVTDYQKLNPGQTKWEALYDRNDRLLGVRHERGAAFSYRYDGNGNLVRQAKLGRDSDGDGLPDWWEFAHGLNLYSAAGNDGAAGDPDGDGWTNLQEFLANTDPRNPNDRPGTNGAAIASLTMPFTPTRFVVGTGQLDNAGTQELVVGADGNPGLQPSFVRVYTEAGTVWTFEDVPIGAYGVTSIVLGQLPGRAPAIYLGLRKVGDHGRVVELTKKDGAWQNVIVAENLTEAADVVGLRTTAAGTDLVLNLAPRFGPEGALYRAIYDDSAWKLSLLNSESARRATSVLGRASAGGAADRVLRLLDNGGIQSVIPKITAYAPLDEFNEGFFDLKTWTTGGSHGLNGSHSLQMADGLAQLDAAFSTPSGNGAPDASASLHTETLWTKGQQAFVISIPSAGNTMPDPSFTSGGASVALGGTAIYSSGSNHSDQNIVLQVLRLENTIYHRRSINGSPWADWAAISPAPSSLDFNVAVSTSAANRSATASMRLNYIRYVSVPELLAAGPSADFSNPDAAFRSSTGTWYLKTPTALSWREAQLYAFNRGGTLTTVDAAETNTWLQGKFTGDFWLGYYRDYTGTPWRWVGGATTAYANWLAGQPATSLDQWYAFSSAGSWSSAAGTELKSGIYEVKAAPLEVSASTLAEPISARRLQWTGRNLAHGFFNAGTPAEGSVVETFIDDRDASGTVTTGDEFVVAELVPTAGGIVTRTLTRRTLTGAGMGLASGLAAPRPRAGAVDLLVTAEPDGQLNVWSAPTAGAALQRQSLSVQHVGRSWHALEPMALAGSSDGLVGLRVDRVAPQRTDVFLWTAVELGGVQSGTMPPIPQTPPTARILASPNSGGGVARVDVRLFDQEGNAARLETQFQNLQTSQWQAAALATIDGLPASPNPTLSAPAAGATHQLVWNAAQDFSANFKGTVMLRVRATDFLDTGNWSEPTPYAIDLADDTDGDGLSDAWERLYFGDLRYGPNDDPDGDGSTNLQEFQNGTRPNDTASAKYTLTVAGVGAAVAKSPNQALYDQGVTVSVSGVAVASSLTFIGWAPTAALPGGGYAAAVATNPLPIVMTANKALTAYAGLPLADALDTTGLVWTTGGHALWNGQNGTAFDGVDAAQVTGLGAVGNEAWLETTVAAPGTLSWRSKLEIVPDGGSTLQLFVGGALQESLTVTTGWSQRTMAIAGSGPTKVRWRFVRQSASAAAPNEAAFLDTVAYATAAAPVITLQPQPTSVSAGGSASFAVAATSTAPLTYRWQRKPASQTEFSNLNDGGGYSGTGTASLVVANATATMSGDQFRCLVANGADPVISDAASLTVVIPPTITTQTQALTIQVGGDVSFSVVAAGTAPFTYQWRKNGTAIPGAVNASFSIANAQPADAGDYSVAVANAAGTVFSNAATLVVVTNAIAPVITSHPANVSITAGQTATFAVAASGVPTPTYQWRKNGANLTGATGPTLTLTNVQPADAGTYFAVATNGLGSVTSNPASLTVLPLPFAPRIITQPTGQTVNLGATATFAVVADGFPAPSYQWRKDGSAIAGANGPTLRVTVADQAAAAVYTVVVTNTQGFVTSDPAVLSIASAPVITQQPIGQSVSEGANVTLAVVATATPAPTYQWRRDGINVSGAITSLLVLNNITIAQSGVYTVIVSNAAGSVFSAPATVNVIHLGTTASHTASGGGYIPGATVTINNALTFPSNAASLGLQVIIPAGWSYGGGAGSEGDVKPVAGAAGALEWAWSIVPPSPLTFSYTLNVPAGTTGEQQISGYAIVRVGGEPASQILVQPDPLRLLPMEQRHSADSDRNLRISLLELTRVIELYNTRNGTTRTGCYRVLDGSEDGFAGEPTRGATAVISLVVYHSADSNRDGKLSLLELTRVIELYNYRSGTTRTGQYHVQPGTEDNFGPGQ